MAKSWLVPGGGAWPGGSSSLLSSLLSGAHLITGPTPGARPGSFWGPTGAAEPVCEKQASGPIE